MVVASSDLAPLFHFPMHYDEDTMRARLRRSHFRLGIALLSSSLRS